MGGSTGPEAARRYDAAYEGSNPWDIGRPQGEVVRLDEAGEFRGRILDCGCGAGENSLYLASRGREVVGLDMSSLAVRRSREKAAARGLDATFLVANALELHGDERLGGGFDTALDSGLFQVLSDPERARYAESLRGVLRGGGTLLLICFSEHERFARGPVCGPRGVTRDEIRATFAEGWRVNYLRESRFDGTDRYQDGFLAWLASLTRV